MYDSSCVITGSLDIPVFKTGIEEVSSSSAMNGDLTGELGEFGDSTGPGECWKIESTAESGVRF